MAWGKHSVAVSVLLNLSTIWLNGLLAGQLLGECLVSRLVSRLTGWERRLIARQAVCSSASLFAFELIFK